MAEVCAECAGSFGSKADLLVHMRHEHPSPEGTASSVASHVPVQLCPVCGAHFADAHRLAAHLQQGHPKLERGLPVGRPTY